MIFPTHEFHLRLATVVRIIRIAKSLPRVFVVEVDGFPVGFLPKQLQARSGLRQTGQRVGAAQGSTGG